MSLEQYNKRVEELKANTINTTTTEIIKPIKPIKTKRMVNNPNGRPKGSKNKVAMGLSFSKRMKVLQNIINDPNEKTSDRILAVKTMTDMNNDRIKETINGNQEITLSLDIKEIKENKETKENLPDTNNILSNNTGGLIVESPASKTLETPAKDIKDVEQQVDMKKVGELDDFSDFSNTGAEIFNFDIEPEQLVENRNNLCGNSVTNIC